MYMCSCLMHVSQLCMLCVSAHCLQAQEAEFGVNFSSPDLENGPTHPLSLKRSFGSSEPIKVKLYRDHAGEGRRYGLTQ